MRHPKKGILLSTIIFLTFIAISLYGAYHGALQTRAFVREKELPAVGLAVSARLDKAAYRYKKVGEELLEGDVLRDWILSGEEDLDEVVTFMKKVRERYDLIDASLVSDKTEKYYNSDEVKKVISSFEKEYGVRIRLARKDGKVVYTTESDVEGKLTDKTLDTLVRKQADPMGVVFENGKQGSSLSWGTYLRDWNSYLLVDKPRDEIEADMRESMYSSFLPLAGMAFILFLISLFSVRYTFKIMRDSLQRKEKKILLQESALRFTARFVRRLDTSGEYKEAAKRILLWSKDASDQRNNGRNEKNGKTGREEKDAAYDSVEIQEVTGRETGTETATTDRKGEMPPEDVLEPVLLSVSSQAEKYTISLHWKLEKSGLLLGRDGAFALDIAFREICRHILDIGVPGIIIPIAGSPSDESYTVELASNIRRDYFSSEILEEVRKLLSIAGISLSTENTQQGMNLSIIIPRNER